MTISSMLFCPSPILKSWLRPWVKLCLARGARRRNAETPLRSRTGRPLGQNSTSLEGWTPPRAKLCLAQGLRAPSCGTLPRSRATCTLVRDSASLEARVGPPPQARDTAPTPPTRALNALACRGRPGQEQIHATPSL
jgi:hypothetical protein